MVFGLAAMALMGAVGAAVDYARLSRATEILQGALDEATIQAKIDGTSTYQTTGANVLAANLTQNGINSSRVHSSFDLASGIVTGKANLSVPLTFMSILGKDTATISAIAKANAKSQTQTTTVAGDVCILLKSTGSQALLFNSGATVNGTNCQIHVASAASSAAVFNSGINIQTKKICIKSTSIINNGGTHPNTVTGCTPQSDPYAGKMPAVTVGACDYTWATYNGGTITLKPGVYCGVNFNSTTNVNFQSGLYILKGGDWNVNGGTWNGTGVTFYYADTSKIQFNSGVTANLSAPTTGTYANILFFENPSLSSNSYWTFNDSTGHNLNGLFYLPTRNVTINSGSTSTFDSVTMVFNTLTLNSMSWNITPHTSTALGSMTATTTVSGAVYLSH